MNYASFITEKKYMCKVLITYSQVATVSIVKAFKTIEIQ
jgi:hypothetical protein